VTIQYAVTLSVSRATAHRASRTVLSLVREIE
jgi:hypothetical protein